MAFELDALIEKEKDVVFSRLWFGFLFLVLTRAAVFNACPPFVTTVGMGMVLYVVLSVWRLVFLEWRRYKNQWSDYAAVWRSLLGYVDFKDSHLRRTVDSHGRFMGDGPCEVVLPMVMIEVAHALLLACKVKVDEAVYDRVATRNNLPRQWS